MRQCWFGWLLCCWVSISQATELQIVDTLNANPQQSPAQSETQTLDYLLKRLPLSYQLVDMNRSRAQRYTEQADYRQLALAGIPPAQQAAVDKSDDNLCRVGEECLLC